MYIRFFVYVNNTQYSREAKQAVVYNSEYNGGEILDKLPQGRRFQKM